MTTKVRFSKFLSILVVLGLMLSMGVYNIGGVAFAQADDNPTLEPTLTELPPTELPPTEVSPTEVSPTEVPPTELPPTELPPTELPPTELPPTELPPTELPPTELPPTELPPTESPTAMPTIAPTDTPAPPTGPVYIEGQPWSISGWFSIVWGDGPEGASQMGYTLTDDSGQATPLLLDETLAQSLGGVLSFDRKYVSVEGVWATPLSDQGEAAPLTDQGAPTVLNVTSISLATSPATELGNADVYEPLTGTKPWIAIMCKFSDIATEPKNLAYFQGMDDNVDHRLDHFWRQLSYNNIDLIGSNAAGWYWLPNNEAHYEHTNPAGLNHLANDCLAAADPYVNYALYQNGGINMMFNYDWYSGWAWGGSITKTLDGVTKSWSITWEPPWAYAAISVIQHEMGHGFGLPHSSGAYGQVYDNAWDVMSKDRYNCAAHTDPTYGCIAQQTISYHKDKLGWILAGQKFTPSWGSSTTISLEQLALPATSNYKMAKIPIGGSSTHFYTVEARRLTGYDIKLAGAAVIIHEVDTTRSRPAYVIDPDLNGNTADAGAMWIAGETFTDATNQISVAVLSAIATGFTVKIQLGPVIPAAPTPQSPSGPIGTGNPTFIWTKPADATKYALYVYTAANVLKFASSAFTATCGASTCSYTPTLNLTAGNYKWAVKAGNANGWSAYSIWKTFTVGPPAAPTPLTPNGPIATGNPTFTWTRPAGVTAYALYVYTTANVMKFANYVTPTCGASTCYYTDALSLLTTGSYKWAVRAQNTFGWSAYSTWKCFGCINSQFNGDSTCWQAHWGSWSILSGAYYYSVGLSDAWSSASYSANYTNFDYQARFSRVDPSNQGYNNALIFRATPGSYATPPCGLTCNHLWNNMYMFGISDTGYYMVYKRVAGSGTWLQGWTYSAYINKDSAWNTLRVHGIGTTLYFYINGNLVLTKTDSSFASGRVGLTFYHGGSGYSYRADWATLSEYFGSSITGSPDTTMGVISPAQMALNEAANKDPKNMLNPAYYIPPK